MASKTLLSVAVEPNIDPATVSFSMEPTSDRLLMILLVWRPSRLCVQLGGVRLSFIE